MFSLHASSTSSWTPQRSHANTVGAPGHVRVAEVAKSAATVAALRATDLNLTTWIGIKTAISSAYSSIQREVSAF